MSSRHLPYIRKFSSARINLGTAYRNQLVSLLGDHEKIIGLPVEVPVNRGFLRECNYLGQIQLGGLGPMLNRAGIMGGGSELKLAFGENRQFMISSPDRNPNWDIDTPPERENLPAVSSAGRYIAIPVSSTMRVKLPAQYLRLCGIDSSTAPVMITFRCGDWFYIEIAPAPAEALLESYMDLTVRLGKYMPYVDGACYGTRLWNWHIRLPKEFVRRFRVEPETLLRCSCFQNQKSILLQAPMVECDEYGMKVRSLINLPCAGHLGASCCAD